MRVVLMKRDERGQIAGLEALAFGVLIFVAATLVVASVWGAVDAKFAAEQAAREAARTYVEVGTDPTAADSAAQQAAAEALAGHHRSTGASVELVNDGYARCGRVAYRVTVPVRVVAVPFLHRAAPGFRVTAVHSELVDPYRSGLAGVSNCS